MIKAAFFDRDGTVNERLVGDWVRNWDQWQWTPDAIEGIRRIYQAGYKLILITNQRGLSIGRLSWEELHELHRRMNEILLDQAGCSFEHIYICHHDKHENCDCRKPEPGMLLQAKKEFPDIDMKQSIMFGDRDIDEQCAQSAGVGRFFYVTENDRTILDGVKELKDS